MDRKAKRINTYNCHLKYNKNTDTNNIRTRYRRPRNSDRSTNVKDILNLLKDEKSTVTGKCIIGAGW